MTKEEINKLAEFVKEGYCEFTKEQAIEALTALNKEGENLKRKEDYEEESDFDIGEKLCSSIDDVVEYLLKLKKEGWKEINLHYGSYCAYRYIEEPVVAYRCRLSGLIEKQLRLMADKENKEIQQRIAEKRKEIKELKSMLK